MMAAQVGIELSPAACRIVEVDAGLPWRRGPRETRVRAFVVLPPSGPETRAKLESLRGRQAAVVVWGGRSEHRQVVVTAGSYEPMRAEALASLAAAGVSTTGVWADIAPASAKDKGAARRAVVVSMASASDLTHALQPLREAGVRLRTVTTPAVALSSLARLRRAISAPDAIEAYVALDEQVTCIALVRNSVLLAAQELAWGYIDRDYTLTEPRPREDIAARLAEAVGEFVAAIGGEPGDIGQVCLCGGLPDLRSMSASLMERLDVEVEPLDSLFGIDAVRLPEPADEFRERGAELRVAWAVAADWPPAINLLRARKRYVSKMMLGRAAVMAGAAAGLGGGWWVVERSHLWDAPAPVARVAANAVASERVPLRPAVRVEPSQPVVPAMAPVVTPPPAAVTPPPAVVTKASVATPPPIVATKPPVVTSSAAPIAKAPLVMPPPAAMVAKALTMTPEPVVVAKAPIVTPPPVVVNREVIVTPRPAVETRLAVATAPPPMIDRPSAVVARPVRMAVGLAPLRARTAPPPEVVLAFDAVLGTILYSPDRKLAIVDNRIVGVGDEVRGARVIEITPATVMLRDTQGRLRRLALGAGGR